MHYLIEMTKKKLAGREESYSKVYNSDESDVDDIGFNLFDDDYEMPQRLKFTGKFLFITFI